LAAPTGQTSATTPAVKSDNIEVKPQEKSSKMDEVLGEMKTLVDSNITYGQTGDRSSLSTKGLEKLDCSETVSVFLKKLSIMAADKAGLVTSGMTNEKDFQKGAGSENVEFVEGSDSADFTPQPGDIFVWRTEGKGHTGIVYSVDGDKITILEAIASGGSAQEKYNKANGGSEKTGVTRTAVYTQGGKALAGHTGWVGYFRPKLTNK
jgi:hypothetical protein